MCSAREELNINEEGRSKATADIAITNLNEVLEHDLWGHRVIASSLLSGSALLFGCRLLGILLSIVPTLTYLLMLLLFVPHVSSWKGFKSMLWRWIGKRPFQSVRMLSPISIFLNFAAPNNSIENYSEEKYERAKRYESSYG